jgi:hypothetical protein
MFAGSSNEIEEGKKIYNTTLFKLWLHCDYQIYTFGQTLEYFSTITDVRK